MAKNKKLNFNTNTSNNDEWLTDPRIVKSLGPFNLDPCSPIIRPWDTAFTHYNKLHNGLIQEWHGRVWLDPPYGTETFKWIEKLANHGSGTALIFSRTETKGFHRQVFERANAVFFFESRLKFWYFETNLCSLTGEKIGKIICCRQGGSANAPSCLISYSYYDTQMIKVAKGNKHIKGRLVHLIK